MAFLPLDGLSRSVVLLRLPPICHSPPPPPSRRLKASQKNQRTAARGENLHTKEGKQVPKTSDYHDCWSKLSTVSWSYLLGSINRTRSQDKQEEKCASFLCCVHAINKGLVDARAFPLSGSTVPAPAVQNPHLMMVAAIPHVGHITQGFLHISYRMDVLLERQPIFYILLLVIACSTLICVGGILFSNHRSYKQRLEDSFWDSWSCLCSSSTHLRERTRSERFIGFILAIGGLLFYSLLTSTMTAQFKSRMEWLKEGAHSEVMEKGHIVVCGTNSHLTTVLKQLNKSQELAISYGTPMSKKQTVLLLSEHERRETEKFVSHVMKDCPQLNILTRSGSLSNTTSFQKVGVDKARSIILLASSGDGFEADADSFLAVLALQPLLEGSTGKLFVEVFNSSTVKLLKSSMGNMVNPLQNLSSKIFVQCSRQPGLLEVYHELLDHGKQVINIRSFPDIAGVCYQDVRRRFSGAIVCGIIRGKDINFHPKEDLALEATDKLMLICAKDEYKTAPKVVHALDGGTGNTFRFSSSNTVLVSFGSHIGKHQSKAPEWMVGPKECILILGWHPCMDEMVTEYDDYVGPGSELIILSSTSMEERQQALDKKICKKLKNVRVVQQVGNPMCRDDLKAAIIRASSSWKKESAASKQASSGHKKLPLSIAVVPDNSSKFGDKATPDKKAVFALLLAEDICKELKLEVTNLLAELSDAELGKQVMKIRPNLTAIGTDEITGLVTAQVSEQSELNNVWTELLNSWGNEIYIKDIRRYLKPGETPSFEELSERAILREEVAIGYRSGDQTVINPTSKSAPIRFSSGDSLVVISEFEYSSGKF